MDVRCQGERWNSNYYSLYYKKKKKEKSRLVATYDNWCLLGHSAFHLDLSHRL